jgi:FHS family L-fucose permease-like MFS transporter
MIAPTTPTQTQSSAQGKGLFTMADGKSLFITFVLVTSLFLLWGFCNGMIDNLNKHFQDSLHIDKEQSGLVQFANYMGYFFMAIPAGLVARWFGYKGGILVGLALIAGGAFWFIPAINIGAYWAFLLGLFTIAAGMTCLETIANPYATVLGPAASGPTRINMAQTINGTGWILGATIGGHYVFSGGDGTNANAGLYVPYLGIGIFVAVLLVIFIFSKVPDLRAEDDTPELGRQKIRLRPSGGQFPAIGVTLLVVWAVLYFFISPILGLLWGLLNLSANLLPPIKCVLLIAAYITSFILVSRNWDLFRRTHFTLGVVTQFLYVAAQTGIFSFFINYVLENDATVTKLQAKSWLAVGFGIFTLGRLCGSALINKLPPHRVLAAFAVVNVLLTTVVMAGGNLGLYALFGTFFFMSVMYPTIFALGIRGLGDHTKLAASLIVMSIVGGAIAAPFMGHIADIHSMRTGFAVPLVCFVFIAIYGTFWQKLEKTDTGPQ